MVVLLHVQQDFQILCLYFLVQKPTWTWQFDFSACFQTVFGCFDLVSIQDSFDGQMAFSSIVIYMIP